MGARTARINGIVSLPAISAGLACKRNIGEEPDISQLIEEKTPTRSPAIHNDHMCNGTAGSAETLVRARLPLLEEDDESADERTPFIDKVMQAGLDRLVTVFGP